MCLVSFSRFLQWSFAHTIVQISLWPRCPPSALLLSVASSFIFCRHFSFSASPSATPASHRSSNLSPSSVRANALPAGRRRRLPEGRTGVVTHTPLSTRATCGNGRTLTQRWVADARDELQKIWSKSPWGWRTKWRNHDIEPSKSQNKWQNSCQLVARLSLSVVEERRPDSVGAIWQTSTLRWAQPHYLHADEHMCRRRLVQITGKSLALRLLCAFRSALTKLCLTRPCINLSLPILICSRNEKVI